MADLGYGTVIVTRDPCTVEVRGTHGGGYREPCSEAQLIDRTAHGLQHALYGQRPVGLVAPEDIKQALRDRGYKV